MRGQCGIGGSGQDYIAKHFMNTCWIKTNWNWDKSKPMRSKPGPKGVDLDGNGDDGLHPTVAGGAVSPNRDTSLLQQMAQQVRRIALCRPLLIAVDGLNTYLSVFRDAFLAFRAPKVRRVA
jgi:hypothetical protein